jgi:hypothetical protein
MMVLGVIGGIFAVLLAIGALLNRRTRQRVRDTIAQMGGTVVAVQPGLPWRVRYVGPEGDLRQATVQPRGKFKLIEDRPYQDVLRERYESSRDTMLRELILAAEYSKLPGHGDYIAAVRELVDGGRSTVTIEESADHGVRARLAPILQCLEAVGINCKSADGQPLELNAFGKSIKLRWSVTGIAPSRRLMLKLEP